MCPTMAGAILTKTLAAIISLTGLLATTKASNDGFIFNKFGANISLDGAAAITSNGVLGLTSISSFNQVGHAFYNTPILFKNPSANFTLSFSTIFVIQLVPKSRDYSGNGMAFVICPSKDLSGGQPGGYLGFLNSSSNGEPENHIVAIEFDTVPNSELGDKDDNHVGIDVNSMVSVNASPAGYYRDLDGKFLDISLRSGKPIIVWADYDAGSNQFDVTIAPLDVPKPRRPLVTYSINLSTILQQPMHVGFSAAVQYVQTAHYVLGWSFQVNGETGLLDLNNLPRPPSAPSDNKHGGSKILLTILIVVPAVLGLLASILLYVFCRRLRRRRRTTNQSRSSLRTTQNLIPSQSSFRSTPQPSIASDQPPPQVPSKAPRPVVNGTISYEELSKATANFNRENLIQKGNHGGVYKGEGLIAVKVIHVTDEIKLREIDYEKIRFLSSHDIKHPNMVRLRGFAEKSTQLLLVYDFVVNGSLERYLHGINQATLGWETRLKIIKQVAFALHHLHHELKIVHGNVKPTNVLLDGDWNAKLGDYGILSRHVYEENDPSLGYVAKEAMAGRVKYPADVYAFGMLVMEVISGKKPSDRHEFSEGEGLKIWVMKCFGEGKVHNVVDEKMEAGWGEHGIEKIKLVLQVALLCSRDSYTDRPVMEKVIKYLKGEEELPEFRQDYSTGEMPSNSSKNDNIDEF